MRTFAQSPWQTESAPWNEPEAISQVDDFVLNFLNNQPDLINKLGIWIFDAQAALTPQADIEDQIATALMEYLVNGVSSVRQPYYDLALNSLYSVNWDNVASKFFQTVTTSGQHTETQKSQQPAQQPARQRTPLSPEEIYTQQLLGQPTSTGQRPTTYM